MPSALPRYFSAALSDLGFVRPNNEDRVYCDEARGVFSVIDGMGGHEAGEQAAEIAVERIRARLERQSGSAEQRLREAITLANNAIFESAREKPEWKGMACVLTVAIVEEGQVTVGHVGDSRLYKIKRGAIDKITRDHSPVGEREDSGELTEAEAMRHPRRNEVYRDVGSEEHTPGDENFIEIFQFSFEPDSAFLLCSDGLSDAVSSQNILKTVEENAGDRWATIRTLISKANKVGKDNVSAVLVEGDAFAASFGKQSVASDTGAYDGERTDRLGTVTAGLIPWYRSGPALLCYGLLLGSVLTFLIGTFVLRNNRAHTARALLVTAPDSISDTLAKAQPGDTIEVGPGTYEESVRLKEGVTMIAREAREAVIQGSVSAENIQGARLEGFQIRGGDIGVRLKKSNVILSRDDISESRGAGIELDGNSQGAILACRIHGNAGPGIVLLDTASPAIENNVIAENGTQPNALRPGLFIRSSSRPIITGNTFAGNGAEAIWLPTAEEGMAQRNFFPSSGHAVEQSKFRIVPLGEGRP